MFVCLFISLVFYFIHLFVWFFISFIFLFAVHAFVGIPDFCLFLMFVYLLARFFISFICLFAVYLFIHSFVYVFLIFFLFSTQIFWTGRFRREEDIQEVPSSSKDLSLVMTDVNACSPHPHMPNFVRNR